MTNKVLIIIDAQINHTDYKLETTNGQKDIKAPFADNIFVSDQKDRMELFR